MFKIIPSYEIVTRMNFTPFAKTSPEAPSGLESNLSAAVISKPTLRAKKQQQQLKMRRHQKGRSTQVEAKIQVQSGRGRAGGRVRRLGRVGGWSDAGESRVDAGV